MLTFKIENEMDLHVKVVSFLKKRYPHSLFTVTLGENQDTVHNSRKNDLILIMTPEKQDKTLELSKHWSVDSTPARNEMIMNRTYPVKLVKCYKICSNY